METISESHESLIADKSSGTFDEAISVEVCQPSEQFVNLSGNKEISRGKLQSCSDLEPAIEDKDSMQVRRPRNSFEDESGKSSEAEKLDDSHASATVSFSSAVRRLVVTNFLQYPSIINSNLRFQC